MASTPSRRSFLKASAGLATLPGLAAVAYAGGSERIKVGLIGCGGRGTGAAMQALAADKGAVLVAMGDIFADRLANSYHGILKNCKAEQLDLPEERRFVGFDAFRKVIEASDVVLLATPPAFRPQHLRAAVEAGRHVFCEKPVAVDAPGIRSVLETARLAKQKGLALASGFCWRAHYGIRAVYGEIHAGRLGEVRHAYGTYLTGELWYRGHEKEWSEREYQLRNWYYYTYLSGDHVVEQAIHSVDKILLAFGDQPPLRCTATGGRQVRTDPKYGHIYDHFSVVYDFPNGASGHLLTRQQNGCAMENNDYVQGSEGVARIEGWTPLFEIRGKRPWKYDGPSNNMYQTEHDELFASIRAGEPKFQGIEMAHSTLAAIMGRMAAYTGQRITWEQALASTEDLSPDIEAFGDAPDFPVAMPGRTKFV